MTKNANGEGSIYKRTRDGKPLGYGGAVTYEDADGRTRRHTVYGRTRAEVREKLGKVRERLDAGGPPKDASVTVGAWMARWRVTTLAVSDRKDSTRELYSNLSRRHLEPAPFGDRRLDKLRPTDIEALVLELRSRTKPGKVTEADPKPTPVRALADSTVRQIYTVLRAGLDGAVRDGLLAKNPAAAVKRPGVERREAQHLDSGRVVAVLQAAEQSRYYPALALIANTGLRRGEVLALKWADVDLDGGKLKVAGTLGRVGKRGLLITAPKTDRSRRTVPLNTAMVALLRKHRASQAAEQLRAANQWTATGLVFTTELGTAVDPRNLLRVIEEAAKDVGVAGIGVHTLRHSAAVAWLEAGVHIKAVADLLGHSSVAITGDVYGHTSDETARAAVDRLAITLGM